MTIEEEIQKETARISRLKYERDKGYAIKASRLMREAMALVEAMDTLPDTVLAADHMAKASDALSRWGAQ